ncbi:MAG: CBS domain-containing protein [Vicinamibacteria bacterium]|nr:CBS domain-containing protein [Vicinamibacteria bacterium]
MAAPLKVRDVMTTSLVTLSPEDNLMDALQLMRLRKVRRIPIVVGDKLVGLLTEGDLKRAEPSTLTETEERFTQVMEQTQILQIMVHNLLTTTPDTPLLDATRILRANKYGTLPVLEGDKLVGILTDNDLLGALVKVLEDRA